MHEHGDGHGADSAGHWRDGAALWRDFGEGHVAYEFRAFWRTGIGDAVDAYINDHRAFADKIRFYKLRLPDGRDEDVRLRANCREVLRA